MGWQAKWRTPPIHGSVFGRWLHSPDGGVAMFPESFQPPSFDWPLDVHQFGFPRRAARSADELSAEIENFLAAGPRPLLFYGGSASSTATAHAFRHLLAAADGQGIRTITVTAIDKRKDQTHPANPDHFAVQWTNLDKLLPRTLGFVHHGGIGSCAAGLEAKVPQLIIASAFDQFQNGFNTQRLKAGRWMRSSEVTRETASAAIAQAMKEAECRRSFEGNQPEQLASGETRPAVDSICDYLDRSSQN